MQKKRVLKCRNLEGLRPFCRVGPPSAPTAPPSRAIDCCLCCRGVCPPSHQSLAPSPVWSCSRRTAPKTSALQHQQPFFRNPLDLRMEGCLAPPLLVLLFLARCPINNYLMIMFGTLSEQGGKSWDQQANERMALQLLCYG